MFHQAEGISPIEIAKEKGAETNVVAISLVNFNSSSIPRSQCLLSYINVFL